MITIWLIYIYQTVISVHRCIKRAFMAKCGIIAPGSPRNDIFVIRDDKLDAKAKMEFLKNKNLLL